MVRAAIQKVAAIGLMGMVGALMLPWPPGGVTAEAAERPVGPPGAPAASEGAPPSGAEGLEDGVALEEEAMRAWLASMDESVPMGDTIKIKPECIAEPYECPYMQKCEFGGVSSVCTVTQCGHGKCGICPPGLNELLIKGWCAYGCMRGTEMVGGAFLLKTPKWAFQDKPHCIAK